MLFLLLAPDDDAVISELFLENYHRLRRAAAAILRDSAAAEDVYRRDGLDVLEAIREHHKYLSRHSWPRCT